MPLTAGSTIVAATLVTVAAAVVGVLLWRRVASGGRRLRWGVRTAVLLGVEALLLATTALAANRALDIYPSWSTLLGQVHATARTDVAAQGSGTLEEWLRARPAQAVRDGFAFSWTGGGWTGWHLAAAPVVALPAAYFPGGAERFPVVVVVGDERSAPDRGGWDDRHALPVARLAAPAVVVFVRVTPRTPPDVLRSALPRDLATDLRVQPDNWAVVGVGAQGRLATALLGDATDRYRRGAWVSDGADRPEPPHGHVPLLVTAGAPVPAWPGPQEHDPAPADRLGHALRWVARDLAPPLAPPFVDPPYSAEPSAPATTGTPR